jgi:hypothetical protein
LLPEWIVAFVQSLLFAGADVNGVEVCDGFVRNGHTPSFLAAQRGHGVRVRWLLLVGTDAEMAETNEGCVPLAIAAQNDHGDVVGDLLGHGARKKQEPRRC